MLVKLVIYIMCVLYMLFNILFVICTVNPICISDVGLKCFCFVFNIKWYNVEPIELLKNSIICLTLNADK